MQGSFSVYRRRSASCETATLGEPGRFDGTRQPVAFVNTAREGTVAHKGEDKIIFRALLKYKH